MSREKFKIQETTAKILEANEVNYLLRTTIEQNYRNNSDFKEDIQVHKEIGYIDLLQRLSNEESIANTFSSDTIHLIPIVKENHWTGLALKINTNDNKAELHYYESINRELGNNNQSDTMILARLANLLNNHGYNVEANYHNKFIQNDRVSCGSFTAQNLGNGAFNNFEQTIAPIITSYKDKAQSDNNPNVFNHGNITKINIKFPLPSFVKNLEDLGNYNLEPQNFIASAIYSNDMNKVIRVQENFALINPDNDVTPDYSMFINNDVKINYTEDFAEHDEISFFKQKDKVNSINEQSINYSEVYKTGAYIAENLMFMNELAGKAGQFITGEKEYKFADVETVKNTSTLLHISSSFAHAYATGNPLPILNTALYTANNHIDIKEHLLENNSNLDVKTVDNIECFIGAGVQALSSLVFFGFTGAGAFIGALPFAKCITNSLLHDKPEELSTFNYLINATSNVTGMMSGSNKFIQAFEAIKGVYNTYSHFSINQLPTDNSSSEELLESNYYDAAEILVVNHDEAIMTIDS